MERDDFPPEDELEQRQAPALYPLGRALRTTFDAENHDSLGTDLTGLMLELARIDPDATPLPRGEAPSAQPLVAAPLAPPPPAPCAQPSGWRAALARLLGR